MNWRASAAKGFDKYKHCACGLVGVAFTQLCILKFYLSLEISRFILLFHLIYIYIYMCEGILYLKKEFVKLIYALHESEIFII